MLYLYSYANSSIHSIHPSIQLSYIGSANTVEYVAH